VRDQPAVRRSRRRGIAERLRDRTARHLDVRVGSVCSPDDKLIDIDQPESSWLLKKVRGQQGTCGPLKVRALRR
jgi:hypothetical protein